MESTEQNPTTLEASAALEDAAASRAALAHLLRTPPLFFTSIGVAIAVQVAMSAVAVAWSVGAGGMTGLSAPALAAFAAGVAVLLVVAGLQLRAFRQLNGVWLDGLLSHVVFGSGVLASAAYVVALFVAIWAAIAGQWWLVAASSTVGGTAYALAGRRWLLDYRAAPERHTRGVSKAMVALAVVVALAGLALLIVTR